MPLPRLSREKFQIRKAIGTDLETDVPARNKNRGTRLGGEWLRRTQNHLAPGKAWAVNAFTAKV
jgi:hypothetical protein